VGERDNSTDVQCALQDRAGAQAVGDLEKDRRFIQYQLTIFVPYVTSGRETSGLKSKKRGKDDPLVNRPEWATAMFTIEG
jgi:hypothetical protein